MNKERTRKRAVNGKSIEENRNKLSHGHDYNGTNNITINLIAF